MIEIQANFATIKLTGVFKIKYSQLFSNKLRENGYELEVISGDIKSFYKDAFYPEFRTLLFYKDKDIIRGKGFKTSEIYVNENAQRVSLVKKNGVNKSLVSCVIKKKELFVFPDEDLHFFSIELEPSELYLSSISDALFCFRNFYSELDTGQSWHEWISVNCLAGIKIVSDSNDKVPVDEFSGSKLKTYTIIDIDESKQGISENERDEYLYDIGSVAKIGSAKGNEYLSPSKKYFSELLSKKISVFKNYTILPLFDTFTLIGHNVICNNDNVIDEGKKNTWNNTYYRIYLYNWFLKYNIFRFNSEVEKDSINNEREKFLEFINNYHFTNISYNFLPNLIWEEHKKSIEVETELRKLEKRINRINLTLQEKKQERSNILLAIISAVTTLGSIKPVFNFLEHLRELINFGKPLFYIIVVLIVSPLLLFTIFFLFPEVKRKVYRKLKNVKK